MRKGIFSLFSVCFLGDFDSSLSCWFLCFVDCQLHFLSHACSPLGLAAYVFLPLILATELLLLLRLGMEIICSFWPVHEIGAQQEMREWSIAPPNHFFSPQSKTESNGSQELGVKMGAPFFAPQTFASSQGATDTWDPFSDPSIEL